LCKEIAKFSFSFKTRLATLIYNCDFFFHLFEKNSNHKVVREKFMNHYLFFLLPYLGPKRGFKLVTKFLKEVMEL
jgi:hypothetical protein